jgi:oxygen-independent coproporphyrinogen III oxidase
VRLAADLKHIAMPSALEKYAEINVPRYTSYPTAPHFSTHFLSTTYREWLTRLDPIEPVSLYLHVSASRCAGIAAAT